MTSDALTPKSVLLALGSYLIGNNEVMIRAVNQYLMTDLIQNYLLWVVYNNY